MDGIADYIKWLGRFSFRELPFNEVDALVLCVIAYFDLGPALVDGAASVGECLERFEDGSVRIQITGGDMGNSAIARAAMESRRFGDLGITDYEDVVEPAVPLQFSAVTFQGEDFAFIAYRGTDETLVGWRENFMISFTETEAQRVAAEYARRVIRPGRRTYMGGHSKGGNLVLYAAGMLEETAWAQVERVFILDGPGLCPEVLDTSVVERVNGKATRILPEFSVVGKLFEPPITDTRIVRSSAAGILQHSLATWGVEYGGLALAEANDRHSLALMRVLNAWIGNMTTEGRRSLTEDLFGALEASGARYLSDIAGSGPGGFEAVLVKMFHASDATREIMKDLPAQVMTLLKNRLRPAAEG